MWGVVTVREEDRETQCRDKNILHSHRYTRYNIGRFLSWSDLHCNASETAYTQEREEGIPWECRGAR